ncbi:MAG: hypothetical protein JRH18_03050 [Deltaproteobacteria bacterium]|nr:hypothetical protein [Deltaproteobacteria bacterium]MBW1960224.1 hypothetical protein [Deltaproteobacteria bacterium]MBW2150627.1 hypothetical protein [Deltaproteobacteria bacterium]
MAKHGDLKDFICKLPVRLNAISASLQKAVKDVEPKFMRLGDSLQSVYTDAASLSKQMIETVKGVGGESDTGGLGNFKGLTGDALAVLKNSQSDALIDLNHINIIVRHISELYEICETSVKIGKFLKVIGYNIRIQSSCLKESRQDFEVVAEEIKDLSAKVMEISRSIRDECKAVRESQLSASKEITAALSELEELSDKTAQSVMDSAEQVEHLMGGGA